MVKAGRSEHALPGGGADKRETLRRIVEVARQEFAAKGLAGARMDDIAKLAGVSRQLIYQYYANKEELFAFVLDQSSELLMPRMVSLELDSLPPRLALHKFLNQVFDQFHGTPYLGRLAQEAFRYRIDHATPNNQFLGLTPVLVDKLGDILRRGEQSGDFKPGVDPRYFFAIAVLSITGIFINPYMMSVLLGFEVTTAEAQQSWRQYAVEQAMAMVLIPAIADRDS